MSGIGCLSSHGLIRWSFAAVALAMLASSAQAALVNKYTFNDGTANDPTGGQNGTVVDNTGISQFVGGMVDLSGNNGAGSNQDFSLPATVGAYVDLPNGVFTNAVTGGTYGAVTLEAWFKVQQQRDWAEVYSFGTSNAGENSSGGAGTSDYVALIPRSGGGFGDYRAVSHSMAGAEAAAIGSATPPPVNVLQHAVFVLDQNDTGGGVNLNGTATFYINNGAPVTAPIEPFIDVMTNDNNWLGRSQWPDPLFDGAIDEFRIYDHALTSTEVATSFATGPEPSLLPKLEVNRDTGAVQLTNASGSGVQIKGYSIMSAAGALNPATWTSIDAGNVFDPNGTWTAQSSTSLNLAESVTGGTLDGGTLAANSSRGIGTPWFKTPIEDLVFSFTLGDNTTGFGAVEYVGAPFARSDLNADGEVDVLDWGLFLPNAYTDISGETGVGAYRKGDLDGDFDNDYADFLSFKADFIAANGAAAFSALVGAVPEPSTLGLLAAASLATLTYRRRKTSMRSSFTTRTVSLLLILAIGGAALSGAQAAPVHRYSFTANANDSVGTAHGTVVDPGAATAVFAAGQLDLSANTGQGSNGITEDAYVNLPNGIVTAATSGGVAGQLTIEMWARSAENRNWAALFSAGTSNDGEDTSAGGNAADYIQIIPQNGANQLIRTTTHRMNVGAEGFVDYSAPLSTTAEQHLVTVYDQSSGLPGNVTLYVDGTLVGSAAIAQGLDIATMPDNNNWIGRSQWNDSVFDGFVNELRIYDYGLTPLEVATNFQDGPDDAASALLTMQVNKTTGQVTFTNNAAFPINAEFYRLSSAASALSFAGWNSLDTQNYDAVDGTDGGTVAGDSVGEGWDKGGGSDNSQLIEYFLAEAGSSIGPNETLSLGNAYNKNVFGSLDGDLKFTLGVVGGFQMVGSVTYVSGGVAGDYNGDGTVNAADYTVWRDTLNQSGPDLAADGDGNGTVNQADYTYWKDRFGNTSGSGSAAASSVPEPAGLFTLLVAVVGVLTFSRRERRCATLPSNGLQNS